MKNLMTGLVTLLGRIALAGIFLISGLSKIGDFQGTLQGMQSRGIPLATWLLVLTIFIEIAGSLALMTGFKAKRAALALIIFLIPVTYIYHYLPGGSVHMIAVLKNISIMGGLLLMVVNGAGFFSYSKD